MKIKILFLAANPESTSKLRLDKEIKAIDHRLQLTKFRDNFEIAQQWAVSIGDLQEYLLRHSPDIVHFSGHGNSAGEIVFESSNRSNTTSQQRHIGDGTREVMATSEERNSIQALGDLFKILKDNIRCVILNSCYSKKQALAIAEHIDCVIGMNTAITDDAAIVFASAFYQGLGYGRNVQNAFDLGRNQIDLKGLKEEDTPQLITLRTDAKDIVFAGPNTIAPIQLSRAPVTKNDSNEKVSFPNLFISYVQSDAEFVNKLGMSLKQKGIEYWNHENLEDAPAGPKDRIIADAMTTRVVLLVLSEHSISNGLVRFEIENAADLGINQGRDVLMPIALDDSYKTYDWGLMLKQRIETYNILNFSQWQEDSSLYEKRFGQVIDGLRLYYKE